MTRYRTGALEYDVEGASAETAIDCSNDRGRTQQHFKDEVNINTLVKRFGLTGQLPQNVRVPLAADFVDVLDYHSAMNAIVQAQNSFGQMPAEVRARFANDPARFVEFCLDEANLPEMRKLGLAVPEAPKPAPADSPAAAPAADPGTPIA